MFLSFPFKRPYDDDFVLCGALSDEHNYVRINIHNARNIEKIKQIHIEGYRYVHMIVT